VEWALRIIDLYAPELLAFASKYRQEEPHMAYDNSNSGTLFKNAKKKEGKQPDYTGTAEVSGKKCKLAGWIKECGPNSRTPGLKFISMRFTPEDDDYSQTGSESSQNDDIPF
jgi:hypothetical protein